MSNTTTARWGRRVATAGCVCALGIGLGFGTAQAQTPGAQKVPLTTNNIDCNGNPAGGQGTGPGTGFVVFNETARGKIIANVVLQDARPNTTYNVRLIQSGSDCGNLDGTITTDSLGDGSLNVQEPAGPSDTAFVAVNNSGNPANDYFTTLPVTF